jgi:hypothetical protein
MADSKITQLPQGLFNQQTILPIVSDGVTSQATFNTLVNSLGPYFQGQMIQLLQVEHTQMELHYLEIILVVHLM